MQYKPSNINSSVAKMSSNAIRKIGAHIGATGLVSHQRSAVAQYVKTNNVKTVAKVLKSAVNKSENAQIMASFAGKASSGPTGDQHVKLASMSSKMMKDTITGMAKAALHNNQNYKMKEFVLNKMVSEFKYLDKTLSKEDGKKLIERAEKMKDGMIKKMLTGNMAKDETATKIIGTHDTKAFDEKKSKKLINGQSVNYKTPSGTNMSLMSSSIKIPSSRPTSNDADYEYTDINQTENKPTQTPDNQVKSNMVDPEPDNNRGGIDYF
ncbi:MAG: hypothetical protein WCG01_02125 [bacterium]